MIVKEFRALISLRLDHPEPVRAEQVHSGFHEAFTRIRLNVDFFVLNSVGSCHPVVNNPRPRSLQ